MTLVDTNCKNKLTHRRNYGISLIMGTIALSYGSVPLYKTVRHPHPHHTLPHTY